MNLNETFVHIFFRLLNFGVLIIGLRHLYLNYVVPSAHTDIEADDKKLAILAQQKDAYYQQEQSVIKEIEDQRADIVRLNAKLEQWRAVAQEAERLQQEEHERLEMMLSKKVALQSAHIAQHMLERRALPRAINELEVSMTSHFAGDERGAQFIKDVINRMEKGR